MGQFEKSLAAQYARQGRPLPERIQNKPKLRDSLQLTLEAFFELDSERHHGNGLQRIPWSSIINYGRYNEYDSQEMDDFVYLIRRMDNHVLEKLGNK